MYKQLAISNWQLAIIS